MKKNYVILLFVLLVTNMLNIHRAHAQANVYDAIIAVSPNHTHFKAALINTNLNVALQNLGGNFTVFAPDNAAMVALANFYGTDINGLLNFPFLQELIAYHIVQGNELGSNDIVNGSIITPLYSGNTLKLTKKPSGEVFVNQAQVNVADVYANNGVVHSINATVLPVETIIDLAIDNGYTSLLGAVIHVHMLPLLTDPFASLTAFAPTNQAFDELATSLNTDLVGLLNLPNIEQILKYHLLDGMAPLINFNNGDQIVPVFNGNTLKFTRTTTGDVYVNHSKVVLNDVYAENGVVHVVDQVLLPEETIVDLAIDNGNSTLVEAFIAARILPTLTNPFGTFTMFAPTNNAFDELATELNTDLNGILSLPELSEILKYHIVDYSVESFEIINGDQLTPLFNDNTIKLTKTITGDFFANHAALATTDLSSFNGTAHLIDKVLLPIETTFDILIDNNATVLTEALIKVELVPQFSNPFESYTIFAPTNDAFDDLATALNTDINGILQLPNLISLVKYHVLPDEVQEADFVDGVFPTVNGASVIINVNNDIKVNNATIIEADLEADNGIVHITDQVILESFLGLDYENYSPLQFYPNPADNAIHIDGVEGGVYLIMSNIGEIVASGLMSENMIRINNLSNGCYHLKITSNDQIYIGKLIKK